MYVHTGPCFQNKILEITFHFHGFPKELIHYKDTFNAQKPWPVLKVQTCLESVVGVEYEHCYFSQ